jgi:hypothetical protein
MIKVYVGGTRNRIATALVLLLALGAVAAFLFVGLMLVAGLVVVGGALATGAAIYRRLRGETPVLPSHDRGDDAGLDPSLEVFPERPRVGPGQSGETR